MTMVAKYMLIYPARIDLQPDGEHRNGWHVIKSSLIFKLTSPWLLKFDYYCVIINRYRYRYRFCFNFLTFCG